MTESQVDIWGRAFQVEGKGPAKAPRQKEPCLVCFRASKEAGVAGGAAEMGDSGGQITGGLVGQCEGLGLEGEKGQGQQEHCCNN